MKVTTKYNKSIPNKSADKVIVKARFGKVTLFDLYFTIGQPRAVLTIWNFTFTLTFPKNLSYMSTTLNKIAYNIAHTLGRQDDLTFIERLKFNIHGLRATIIRRDLDRNNFTPNQYLQTIGCLDMEYVDASSCCGVEVGCNVFRSKQRVPDPIRFKDKVPFYFVGTIDGKKGYSSMSSSELAYIGHNKYAPKFPRYYFDDGYIYLINAAPKTIRVKGVFEYPDQLADFTCDGTLCYDDDSPYPISADLVRSITEALLNVEARMENPNKPETEVRIDG